MTLKEARLARLRAHPGFTFAASANAVTYSGATPFFVDATGETWTIDPELLDPTTELRWEAPGPGSDELFPHLYGPLPTSAVTGTEQLHPPHGR